MAQAPDRLEGVWEAERYEIRSGPVHSLVGRIFFADGQWTVLFLVVGDDGLPHRGSGEGGGYTLRGDSLVFDHQFNFSTGEAMAGLPASPLQMIARSAADAPREPSRIELNGDRLTIFFPSGNAMTFRRIRRR